MELIRTIKEKAQTKRQEDVQRMAENTICLSDFDNELYIVFSGTPLIPINANWTSKEIIQELSKLRQNYVNAKMKNYTPTIMDSIFKTTC